MGDHGAQLSTDCPARRLAGRLSVRLLGEWREAVGWGEQSVLPLPAGGQAGGIGAGGCARCSYGGRCTGCEQLELCTIDCRAAPRHRGVGR